METEIRWLVDPSTLPYVREFWGCTDRLNEPPRDKDAVAFAVLSRPRKIRRRTIYGVLPPYNRRVWTFYRERPLTYIPEEAVFIDSIAPNTESRRMVEFRDEAEALLATFRMLRIQTHCGAESIAPTRRTTGGRRSR